MITYLNDAANAVSKLNGREYKRITDWKRDGIYHRAFFNANGGTPESSNIWVWVDNAGYVSVYEYIAELKI